MTAQSVSGPPPTRLWLTRLFDQVAGDRLPPRITGSAVFGAPPALVIAAYVAIRWTHMSLGYLFSLGAVVVVVCVAPSLIWYYDSHLLPTFREEATALVIEPDVLDCLCDRYRKLITERWWVTALLAAAPIPFLMIFGRPFLRQQGLFGITDPLFWAVFAVLLWIGVIVGIGFLLVTVMILIIRALAKEQLRIDPLHPDGLGGMSVVGDYAIRTTALFSIGALLLPLQLQYAATVGPEATSLIYVMALVYVLFIAASFLYPTFAVNRRADAVRTDILDDLRTQYQRLKREANEPLIGADLTATDSAVEQKLARIREEHRAYSEVRLYPMEITILTRLVVSVALPIVSVGIEYVLRPEVLIPVFESLL